MPCDYSLYHPKWKLIRRLILKRANQCCEYCGVANYEIIKRVPASKEYRKANSLELQEVKIRIVDENFNKVLKAMGLTRVILTISHKDHDKTHNRFENLAALCQRCHLLHDIDIHISKRKETLANRKKSQLKLL